MSNFLKDPDHYIRSINPVDDYINQMARFLSRQTNDPVEQCREAIIRQIQQHPAPTQRDPMVSFFYREAQADVQTVTQPLSQYLASIREHKEILAPSFTSYIPRDQVVSELSDFVQHNLVHRSRAKKAAFQHLAKQEYELYEIKFNEQTNRKLYNNSISGAFASVASVLHNPTGHSTLTSVTRVVTSLGNAINERMVAGNRHYRHPDIVLNQLIFFMTDEDPLLASVIEQYGLVYPTLEDVVDVIDHSTQLYWRNQRARDQLISVAAKYSPIERARFVYSGDFYQLRRLNDRVVRDMIGSMSQRVVTEKDPQELLRSLTELELSLAHHICFDEVKGYGVDYDKMHHDGRLAAVVGTAEHVRSVFEHYYPLIEACFLTDALPASVAYIKEMVRRTVVLSDTDSTCASYQDWVSWYRGRPIVDQESHAVAASVMTITTRSVSHALAVLSANLGVSKEHLHTLEMKNEFAWTYFCPTNVSKHYFASTVVRENNVYAQPDLEVKGVHLKNSALPSFVMAQAKQFMHDITESIETNRPLSMRAYLERVATLEQELFHRFQRGDHELYQHLTIKPKEAYTAVYEKSPLIHKEFWDQIFQPIYGGEATPPYAAIKVPTTLLTKDALRLWIEGLPPTTQMAVRQWLERYRKVALPTVYLPLEAVQSTGIPKELLPILNVKKTVMGLCMVFYILLEAIGYYRKPKTLVLETFTTLDSPEASGTADEK